MKKLIILFSLFFMLVYHIYAQTSVPSQHINVVVDGKAFSGIKVYKVSGQTEYLSIKEIAKIYNASLEWKSVSLQVRMYFNNGKMMIIKVNSTDVVFEKTIKKMSLPSILIKNDIYVPPEILMSPEFSKFSESDAKCNLSNLTLNISHHENISAVKYCTKPESTQIFIQFEKPLRYTISKTSKTIILKILRGKIKSNSIDVHNGVIENIQYGVDGRFVIVKITLKHHPKAVKATKLSNPYGISVNIVHSKDVAASDLTKAGISTGKEEYVMLSDNLKSSDLTSPEKYGQAQISEIGYMIENNESDKDFENVPVTKFEQNNIVDDSSAIHDDIAITKEDVPKPKIVEDVVTIKDAPETKSIKKSFKKHQKIIALDAGYGDKDCGVASENGTKVKNINLEIIRILKSFFEKAGNYKIILTRQGGTFINPAERIDIANKHKADLFISVQCSASSGNNAERLEVYCLSEKTTDFGHSVLKSKSTNGEKRTLLDGMLGSMAANEYMNESLELGGLIVSRFNTQTKDGKQAKFYVGDTQNKRQPDFRVLKGAKMPALLVKAVCCVGGSKFGLKKFQMAIARSIYDGVVLYERKTKKQNNE
ncbi:MAG: N-acetylmuramoyl-L-alanine amidase [Endomicrobium sp.]|jgi:N-acetylmuramoyl-L-alanine amidase|nr:N-acetylmuramoyl-L-alanine amidase [Endomicrobium sp.]